MKTLAFIAVLTLIAPAARAAEPATDGQIDWKAPVPADPPKPFTAKAIRAQQLANGLKTALVESYETALVSINVLIPFAGDAYSPKGKEGLADLTGTMLLMGTSKKTPAGVAAQSADQIAAKLEDLGVVHAGQENTSPGLAVAVSNDGVSISGMMLKENAAATMRIIADIVRHPSMPKKEWDREKAQALDGMKAEKGEVEVIAKKAMTRKLYGSHPYAKEPTQASLSSLTREDAVAFHRSHFGPQGAIISAAGPLSTQEFDDLVARNFKDWSAPGVNAKKLSTAVPKLPTAIELKEQPGGLTIDLVDMPSNNPGKEQAGISIAQMALPLSHPDYFSLRVLDSALGEIQFLNRLFFNLRTRLSWTYGAGSKLEQTRSGGVFVFGSSVKVDKAGATIEEVFHEIAELQRHELPAAELADAKMALIGSFRRRQTKVQGQSGQAAGVAAGDVPADYAARFEQRVNSVTATQARDAARRYFFPTRMQIVVVGPKELIYWQLAPLGNVRVFDIEGRPIPAPGKVGS